jgi:hypothetical protein
LNKKDKLRYDAEQLSYMSWGCFMRYIY